MSKTITKLAVILAAGLLYSGSAYAGVNACFQYVNIATPGTASFTALDPTVTGTLTGGVNNPIAPEILYPGADCTGIGLYDTAQPASKIAYELTQSYVIDLADTNGAAIGGTPSKVVVYIPTTAIPGGSRLTFTLSSAIWQNSVMQLLKWDNSSTNPAGAWAPIATTDGPVANLASATFLVQSGITVQAGTKLMISSTQGTGTGLTASFVPPQIKITNKDCKAPTDGVTLNVDKALTDGGIGIAGAVTKSNGQNNILVITPQQFSITLPATPTAASVNVEPPSLRTKFVAVDGGLSFDTATTTQAIAKIQFTNTAANTTTPGLDAFITLGADDIVTSKFYSSNPIDSFMKMNLFSGTFTINPGVPDTLTGLVNGTVLNDPTLITNFSIGNNEGNATQYLIAAPQLFPVPTSTAATTRDVYEALTTTDPTKVMPYNYTVNTKMFLDFKATTELDTCVENKATHSININGAVFKVPYIYGNSSTFIRVSNEDTGDGLIFGDFFEGGVECLNVPLGTVPAKSSVLLKGDQLVSAMNASGLPNCATLATIIPSSQSNRFFGTFTVTSPKDKVHAYGIQKIDGGLDRYLSILDQNNWNM
jgi:hypothetical protein